MRFKAGTIASRFPAVLFAAVCCMLLVPLAAAFTPLAKGGFAYNISRALSEPRFMASFAYGLSQAFLSALIAAAIGFPAAFLVAKRKFFGKKMLSAFAAVPFCVPAIIIAIGFVLYYGREGALNTFAMRVFGLSQPPLRFLYSFRGLVFTHALYNFPVFMRFVGDAWAALPIKYEEQAALLGASPVRIFFTITLPALMPAIGAALSLIFLVCFFSFVIVLLFGGIGVTTPEVELYRAARFEFDRPLASAFALLETCAAMLVLMLYSAFEKRAHGTGGAMEAAPSEACRFKTRCGAAAAAAYGVFICIAFAGPLASIALHAFRVRGAFGLGNFISLVSKKTFGAALLNSFWLGVGSSMLAALFGFAFSVAAKKWKHPFFSKTLPLLPLAVSSVVLAYGWNIVLGKTSVAALALIQAMLAWPFVLRAVHSTRSSATEHCIDAARTLGSSKLSTVLRVELPLAAPSLLSGFAFSFAMSLGDANALIAAPVSGFETIALLLYRLAGSYRLGEACAAAVLLALISSIAFVYKDARHG